MQQSNSEPRNVSAATVPAAAETAFAVHEDIELSMDMEEINETGGFTFWMSTTSKEPCVYKFVDNLKKIVVVWFVKFKNSPIRNDDLLNAGECAWRIVKELPLLLDTETRWSSLFTMLDRFCLIRNLVCKALTELQLRPSIVVTDEEFDQISSIVQALQVVKLIIEVSCRRDCNLVTEDAALKFMLKKLRT